MFSFIPNVLLTEQTLPIGEQKIDGFYLDENDPVNERIVYSLNHYVFMDMQPFPSNKTATLRQEQVHFHANSGLIVAKMPL
jgi:hypothetical protein